MPKKELKITKSKAKQIEPVEIEIQVINLIFLELKIRFVLLNKETTKSRCNRSE